MKSFSDVESIKIRTKILMLIFVFYTTICLVCTWSEYQNIFSPFLTQVFYIFQVIITPILFILFFATGPDYLEILIYIFCFCVGVFTTLRIHDPRFLMFILFFFGAKNSNYKYILKYNLRFNIGVFIFIISSSFLKILPNITMERETGMYRQSLGFDAPNLLIIAFMIIVSQMIIVKREKFNFWDALFLGGLTVWLGILSDGRGGQISIIIAILLTLLINSFSQRKINSFFSNKIIKYFLVLLPELSFLFMFELLIKIPYGSNLYDKINKIFSFRFDISRFYLENLGIHFWPTKPSTIYLYPWFNGYNDATAPMIDNLYMYLFCFLGIVATIIFLYIYSLLINNALKNQDYWLLTVLIVFLFLGFVESQMVSPFVGIFVITFSNNKWKDRKY